MPRRENFLKKSDLAFLSRNQTKKGVVLADKDVLERRGFQGGANLRLGAIEAD